jgi:NADH:ubiquinone oxidoreductase subunit 2 (subunit N)
LLLYLAIYLFMNLGAFFAVDAIERQVGSDELSAFSGLGRRLPFAAAVLALCLLSLAGIPPLGGFVGKTMLFGAAPAAGWTWLAVVMAANVALSLRVLRPGPGAPLSSGIARGAAGARDCRAASRARGAWRRNAG